MKTCPACSGEGKALEHRPFVFRCLACGALFSSILPESESLLVVLPYWHTGASKPQDERYYDFSGLDSEGKPYRRHGWFNVNTNCITQVG